MYTDVKSLCCTPETNTMSVNYTSVFLNRGFSDSSVGKESACDAGDPSSIPGLGKCTGEGIGYPVFLGFSCGSAGKESTCNAGDLGWEDPLEKGKATHSGILA